MVSQQAPVGEEMKSASSTNRTEHAETVSLPDTFLTPHTARPPGNEAARMGAFMVGTFGKWRADTPVDCEVTMEMLSAMA